MIDGMKTEIKNETETQNSDMQNDFKMCPICGSKKIKNQENRKWICPDCGFDLYKNVAAAVGVIIEDSHKNILFEVRAKEPRNGFLAIPGGFIDFDESAEEALCRECFEELGVKFDQNDFHYICTFPNTYPYKKIEYKTCDIFFKAELPKKYNSIDDFIKALKPEQSEVLTLCSKRVATEEDIEALPLAFESSSKALKKYLAMQKGEYKR